MNFISLVVVNYNSGKLLSECIRSVISEIDDIVIVDNASIDSSIGICVQNFGNFPQVNFVHNKTNLGFSAACNIGIHYAKGNIILFLNPDCRLGKNAVSNMYDVLVSKSTNGMVGGLLLNPDGTEQGGGRRAIPTPWRSFVRAFGLYKLSSRWPKLFYDFHLHKQPLPNKPIEVEAISGACMMVKREVINDVGLWDEGYFLHCEDLDWCIRFRQKGWKIIFVPSAKVEHVHGACSKSRPFFVEWCKHKGMIRFYKKFFKKQYPYGMMWLVYLGVGLHFFLAVLFKLVKLLKRT